MAELRFFFGTMGSGKSTQALQIRHNLAQRGLKVILTTQLDRQEGKVSSRLGVEAEADIVDASVNLFELAREAFEITGLDAMVCDEAQFYEPRQIEQLGRIVDEPMSTSMHSVSSQVSKESYSRNGPLTRTR